MSEYDCFVELVEDCFSDFDERKNITITRNTGSINASTGEFDESSGSSFIMNGLTSPISKELNEETSLETDDILLLSDHSIQPKTEDVVLLDGKNYSIVKIETVDVGGVVIMYKSLLRK